MRRSTMEYWVQACPHCGYVAPDIAQATPDVLEVVRSEAYGRQRRDGEAPELAHRFLCWSFIQEATGDPIGAGWSSVHAAWACDDAGDGPAAARCRGRALGLFQIARQSGKAISEQQYAEYPLLADLWRRTGEFDRALQICEEGFAAMRESRRRRKKAARDEAELIERVLRFEHALIEQRDAGVHTVGEALGEEQAS